MSEPGAALWAFSLDVYARPGVAPACLELQDRFGANVNLLLALVWHAHGGGAALSAEAITEIQVAAGAWQAHVVEPLRAARRSLKSSDAGPPGAAQALRERVKTLELEAERIEQFNLATLLPPQSADAGDTARAAAASLAAYLRLLRAASDHDARTAAAAVLHAAFSHTEPNQFIEMLK